MGKTFTLSSICVILFISHIFILRQCSNEHRENERLISNQVVLLDTIRFYRTSDSLSAASVGQLSLTLSEYERSFTDLNSIINTLNIENKRLESVARTALEASFNITTEWKDSIVYVAGATDTLRSVNYIDDYLTFRAIDRGSFLDTHINIRDTLVQAVHIIPNQFLFIKYGVKQIRQDVSLRSPYSEIVFTEYININRPSAFSSNNQRIGFGIQVGAGYGVMNKQPDIFIGAGISYKIY